MKSTDPEKRLWRMFDANKIDIETLVREMEERKYRKIVKDYKQDAMANEKEG